MKIHSFARRLTTSAALLTAAITGATTLAATPAFAAVTYWSFKNTANNNCLVASGTAVYTAPCGGSRMLWDWVPNQFGRDKLLKHKDTGLCLMTDNGPNAADAVWLSKCNGYNDYQDFTYDSFFDSINSEGHSQGGALRTGGTTGNSVYTASWTSTDSRFRWVGDVH